MEHKQLKQEKKLVRKNLCVILMNTLEVALSSVVQHQQQHYILLLVLTRSVLEIHYQNCQYHEGISEKRELYYLHKALQYYFRFSQSFTRIFL